MENFLAWLNVPNEVWRVVINLALIILALFVVKHFGNTIIDKIIRKTITSDNYSSETAEKMREDTLISILSAILKVALWIFGSMLVLAQLGVNIGPLIAGASVAGIAIGFGAQAIVKDFVSGIFIILENQYRVGDVITLADTTGTVEEITVRQTVLRDANGNKHFIPNGQIGVTTNLTMDYSNLLLHMDISYDADIERVKRLINQVGKELSQDQKFKDIIVEPPKFLRIQDFGAHAVVVRITGKLKPGNQWQVAGEMRLRLKTAFDKNKIEIPYQQLVIHKHKDEKQN